jgi:sugar fermentation stimulation protein A
VILVSTLVNGIFENCIRSGILEEFKEFNNFRREVPSAASRLDFLLYPENEKDKELWIEVKSVNLVEKDKGLFPDAPTSRGVKHLKELMALKQSGKRAAVIFMALREDAHCFSPHTKRDPEFSEALVKAHRIGVEVYAYRTIWNQSGCTGIKPIPVYFFATSG